MKSIQITVRNVDPILKQRIDKLAKMKSMSINDFVLDTLRAKVDLKAPQKKVSWEKYSGLIGVKGINQAVLNDFEAVDKAMWE
jgi:hypothetical protein